MSELRRAACGSIDQFIALRPEFEQVGKAAIAFQLATAEVRERLAEYGDGRWYRYFLNEILDVARTQGTLDVECLPTIATFNYDCSLEVFLSDALSARGPKHQELLGAMLPRIHHLRGHIGGLGDRDGSTRSFGDRVEVQDVRSATTSLGVVGDATKAPMPEPLKLALRASDEVVFLGFRYHRDNLDMLRLHDHCVDRYASFPNGGALRDLGYVDTARFRGTALGLTSKERRTGVIDYFKSKRIAPIHLYDSATEPADVLSFLRNELDPFGAPA